MSSQLLQQQSPWLPPAAAASMYGPAAASAGMYGPAPPGGLHEGAYHGYVPPHRPGARGSWRGPQHGGHQQFNHYNRPFIRLDC